MDVMQASRWELHPRLDGWDVELLVPGPQRVSEQLVPIGLGVVGVFLIALYLWFGRGHVATTLLGSLSVGVLLVTVLAPTGDEPPAPQTLVLQIRAGRVCLGGRTWLSSSIDRVRIEGGSLRTLVLVGRDRRRHPLFRIDDAGAEAIAERLREVIGSGEGSIRDVPRALRRLERFR